MDGSLTSRSKSKLIVVEVAVWVATRGAERVGDA